MLRRLIRLIPLLGMLFLSVGGERQVYRNDSQSIALRPLLLNPDEPQRTKVGRLEFLAAWELNSDNADFGGISGLTVQLDGRFLAVSDAGTLIGFGLTGDDNADRPFIAPMPDAFGRDRNYEDRDSESIVHDVSSGKFWVGYEGKAAIRRFDAAFARREAIARPDAMQKWSLNSGAEALLRLPDGRFIVFSEGYDRPDGSYEALLFSGDPTEKGSNSFAFGYQPPDGYKITDAKMLPDGNILTLNRRIDLSGFSVKLALIDPAKIVRNETITAISIAVLSAPLLVDNMEGLAVTRENDAVIIWMISDDNFNIFQRSLLMKFRLLPAKRDGSLRNDSAKKPASEKAPGFDAI